MKHRFVETKFPEIEQFGEYFKASQIEHMYSNFGPLSSTLERRIIEKFGVPGEVSVSVSSATSGLTAALIALGVRGPVIVPAFTFPASLSAVRGAGLHEAIADVSPDDWALTVDQVDVAVKSTGADAVMLVAPFGMRIDIEGMIKACIKRNLALVIDNAAGLGISRQIRTIHPRVVEVFSMHATKTFVAGEGGLVFCHPAIESHMRSAANFGLPRPDRTSTNWGINAKLSELHCAVALAQLDVIDDSVTQRKIYFDLYKTKLQGFGHLPIDRDLAPWQCIPFLLKSGAQADTFQRTCANNSVEIRRYYRPSLSTLPDAKIASDCPVSEDLALRMCALPVRAYNDTDIRNDIVERVAQAAEECCI